LKWRNGCWRKIYWLSHFLTLSFLVVKRGSGGNYRPHTPPEDLDKALQTFIRVGKSMGVLK
jgi:hypothetical protein